MCSLTQATYIGPLRVLSKILSARGLWGSQQKEARRLKSLRMNSKVHIFQDPEKLIFSEIFFTFSVDLCVYLLTLENLEIYMIAL